MVNWFKRLFSSEKSAERQDAELLLADRDRFFATMEASDQPWAMFEIKDFPADGQIKVEFNWNKAFIARINGLGFQAENEQDTVQLFFYASQMKPQDLVDQGGDDDVAQSDNHPTLTSATNRVAR